MANATFAAALRRVLVHEGGYSNHPSDPGGVTLNGIIQRVYDADRRRRGLPLQALARAMLGTAPWIAERDAIYRRQYWDAVSADKLPEGIDYVVFDGAVNSGPVQSAKWIQRALGVRADGHVGEATLAAAARHPDHKKLIADICDQRLAFLRALKTWPTFGKGWASRVADVRAAGQAMATGSLGVAAVYVAGSEGKGNIEDAKRPPVAAAADIATGGGVATGGLAGALQQAQDALSPLATMSGHIATIVTVLVIAGTVMTAGGLAYGWWARRRAARQREALGLDTVPA